MLYGLDGRISVLWALYWCEHCNYVGEPLTRLLKDSCEINVHNYVLGKHKLGWLIPWFIDWSDLSGYWCNVIRSQMNLRKLAISPPMNQLLCHISRGMFKRDCGTWNDTELTKVVLSSGTPGKPINPTQGFPPRSLVMKVDINSNLWNPRPCQVVNFTEEQVMVN